MGKESWVVDNSICGSDIVKSVDVKSWLGFTSKAVSFSLFSLICWGYSWLFFYFIYYAS